MRTVAPRYPRVKGRTTRYDRGVNVVLTLFSSLLLPLALPNEIFPSGIFLVGIVSLVPVFIVVLTAPSRVYASRCGALFGMVSTAAANYWLAFFGEFSVWTIGGAVLGYTGYNYILFGYLYYLTHQRNGADSIGIVDRLERDDRRKLADRQRVFMGPAYSALVLAIAWTGYEYFKSVGFLGYPWGLVAYPIAKNPWVAQIAEITGVWGLSFLGAYGSAALASLVVSYSVSFRGIHHRNNAVRHIVSALLLLLVAGGFGLVQRRGIEPVGTLDMILVQQNVDSWKPGRFTNALSAAQHATVEELLSSPEERPDAIVWSETSLRVPYRYDRQYYAEEPGELPFFFFLQLIDTPLITGTPVQVPGTDDYRNSAVIILSDRSTTGTYGKQQLVPFAESIPFWDVPFVQRFFRTVVGLSGTWVPGRGSIPLTLPLKDGEELLVGTPICFEDGFGWVPREMVNNGARLLVNLTNNSWSKQNSAQTQHFVAARLRSIELRTTLVRGTNSGLSGVVDARGELISELPMFTRTAKRVLVPLYPDRWTLYRAWGDWLGILSAVFSLFLVVAPQFVGAIVSMQKKADTFRVGLRSRRKTRRNR